MGRDHCLKKNFRRRVKPIAPREPAAFAGPMRDLEKPEIIYHGPLRELADVHLKFVKVLLWFILVLPLGFVAGVMASQSARDTSAFGGLLLAGLLLGWFFKMSVETRRLAGVLYPQVRNHLAAIAWVPGFNVVLFLVLYQSALRQMRARGLRVGFLGIDPSRVD